MNKQYQITKEGRQELAQELESLKARRSAIAEKIAAARDLGDLSENADYDAARDEQGHDETRISEIEDILQNGEIIVSKKSSTVSVGSKVGLKTSDKTVHYQIVGPVEADPFDGKISDKSPLGQALLGKKIGENVEIKTPKGTTKYIVISIG